MPPIQPASVLLSDHSVVNSFSRTAKFAKLDIASNCATDNTARSAMGDSF
jgi:hypothetical protein